MQERAREMELESDSDGRLAECCECWSCEAFGAVDVAATEGNGSAIQRLSDVSCYGTI